MEYSNIPIGAKPLSSKYGTDSGNIEGGKNEVCRDGV
jgi:hypothetical protein